MAENSSFVIEGFFYVEVFGPNEECRVLGNCDRKIEVIDGQIIITDKVYGGVIVLPPSSKVRARS